MKKFFKTFLPVFFAVTMTTPGGALAATFQEFEEPVEEQEIKSDYDGYNLTFLKADLNLTLNRTDLADDDGTLVVFITNADGKIVKEAQVITTIIGSDQSQLTNRAQPYKGGYVINTKALSPGKYRLEAEIITEGLLVTDEFIFQHV